MKILIISGYFPPYNAIGSVRVGKFAKFLIDEGKEIKVLTSKNYDLEKNLMQEIDNKFIYETEWFDYLLIKGKFLNFFQRLLNIKIDSQSKLVDKTGFFQNFIKSLIFWPDRQTFWYFTGKKKGEEIIKKWRPDVIYASAWPITSLIIAKTLSEKFKIPWVAELRDLWIDNHYNNYPFWRRFYDKRLEKKVLSSTNLLITVSEPLKKVLLSKFDVPVLVIRNGFDKYDYKKHFQLKKNNHFVITYTGTLYENKRDPTPLFEALSQMDQRKNKIRVNFYGRQITNLNKDIEKFGLTSIVKVFKEVPYIKSLQLQQESDLLLLLLWNSKKEEGVFTGKIFEYIGARRPILVLGNIDGVAGRLIYQKKLGYVCDNVQHIKETLEKLIDHKIENRKIKRTELSKLKGFSRVDQFKKIIPKLKDVIKKDIVIFTKKLDLGGTEKHILSISSALKFSFNIKIFVLEKDGFLENYFLQENIKIIKPKRNFPIILREIYSFIRIFNYMVSNKNTIIHFFLPKPYILGAICGYILNHDRMLMSRRSLNYYQTKKFLSGVAERILHKKMQFVIGNSKAVMRNLSTEGVNDKQAHLIYNGVKKTKCKNLPKNFYDNNKIKKNIFTMIVVSNLILYKGHIDLLKALNFIKSKILIPWQLLLIGRDDGMKNNLIQKSKEFGIYHNIKFLGQRTDTQHFYKVAHISILPSHEEGFSNSLLEAMYAGLPTIATKVGGNVEVIEDQKNGLLVNKKNPEELGVAILRLLNNKRERETLGQNAKKIVLKKYSFENTIKSYESIYKNVK